MKKLYSAGLSLSMALALFSTLPSYAAEESSGSVQPCPAPLLLAARQTSQTDDQLPVIRMESSNMGTVDTSKINYDAIIIDIWASWCGPCCQQVPVLNALKKKYGNRLFVLGISQDDNEKDHRQGIKAHHVSYPSCSVLNKKNSKCYESITDAIDKEIDGIPFLIVADDEGNIVYSDSGTMDKEDLEAILKPLMK